MIADEETSIANSIYSEELQKVATLQPETPGKDTVVSVGCTSVVLS